LKHIACNVWLKDLILFKKEKRIGSQKLAFIDCEELLDGEEQINSNKQFIQHVAVLFLNVKIIRNP